MDYTTMSPKEVRALIAKGEITGPTAGMCAGYAQANLVILPKDLAYDFLLFTQRNPRSCPLLEVSDTGSRFLRTIAKDADIATEIPRYRIYRDGVLEQRPTLVNIQCDIDHPTQCMADMLHIINHFGGVEKLKGKRIAMSWAYSPSYGKPLSVPQGVIGLMTRFGMDVVLAHPEGYEVMGGVEEVARRNAAATGGSFTRTNDMAEAFAGADIVYPKSWAPFAAMQQRTDLYGAGDMEGIKKLEKELLAQNANHKDWECTEALMASTRNGEALYMHCLPADISGVSCAEGEVAASVFDRYRVPLYKEASYKPYIIAAMITLARKRNPADLLLDLLEKGGQRCL